MSQSPSKPVSLSTVLVIGVMAIAVSTVLAFTLRGGGSQDLSQSQRAEISQIVTTAIASATPASTPAPSPQTSPAAGFSDTQRGQIRDLVKDLLINDPAVLRQALVGLEQFQKQEQERVAVQSIRDNAKEIFRSSYSHVTGNANGSVTMVEFFDYNCGYCKRSLANVVKLMEKDPDLRVVLKEFPILGEGSVYAARAAIASRKQGKYWEFHLALMGARGRIDKARVQRVAAQVGLDLEKLKIDMQAPVVDASIAESHALANKMGIRGTPAFVIADRLIPGALGYDALKSQIDEVRTAGGCKIC